MATETTRLLSGYIINMPKDKDFIIYEDLTKGLSLDELLPFESDPWWQNIRRTFMLSFWVTIIVILTAACIISVLEHGSCSARGGGSHHQDKQLSKTLAAVLTRSNGTMTDVLNRTETNVILAF